MDSESPYVGIDVSKDQLDIAVRPDGDTWSMPNDASGITEVVQRLAQLHPKLVVLEATGGLQYHQFRVELRQSLDYLSDSRSIIRHAPGITVGTHGDIQLIFGDVYSYVRTFRIQ